MRKPLGIRLLQFLQRLGGERVCPNAVRFFYERVEQVRARCNGILILSSALRELYLAVSERLRRAEPADQGVSLLFLDRRAELCFGISLPNAARRRTEPKIAETPPENKRVKRKFEQMKTP